MLALVVPVVAQAGSSNIYLQGGQIEYANVTPCVLNSSVLSNGQPATVADCTTTTADTFYVHFMIPADFNPAVSTQWSVITELMPESDTTASGRYTCVQYSLTAFVPGSNYATGSIADPATSTILQAETHGKWATTYSNTLLVPINSLTGIACGTECRNWQATLKGKRVACTAPYNTDISGAVGVIAINTYYSN